MKVNYMQVGLCLAMLFVTICRLNAQGLLAKLKDQATSVIGGKSASAKFSKSQLKAAEVDSSDTFLDQKATGIAKDKYNISGIWYSNKPIRLVNDLGMNGLIAKKFLLEFDEANYQLAFRTRYAYESSNRNKLY